MNPTNLDTNGPQSPERIEADIHRTKSAIASELKELGDKIAPEKLREGARHIMQDAKEEAREVVREAKDAATESLRAAKDHAMESVNETLDQVSARARRVTDATTSFVSRNAVPLTLFGIGAGWLFVSMRREREFEQYNRRASMSYPMRGESWNDRPQDRATTGILDRGKQAVGRAVEQTKETSGHLVERAQDGAHALADRALDLGHAAGDKLGRAREASVHFAHENPLVLGAVAVAAGVGIGLALPSSMAENQLVGASRDRLVRQVTASAGNVGDAAKRSMHDLRDTLTQPAG